jgi:hypothetical protein
MKGASSAPSSNFVLRIVCSKYDMADLKRVPGLIDSVAGRPMVLRHMLVMLWRCSGEAV